MSKSILVEVFTPRELFYSGEAEMLVVSTYDGEEGFLPNHTWCCTLLAETGTVRIHQPQEKNPLVAKVKGGYVDINEHFVVFVDEAEWIDA
ncbi:F0F1-type ATP synthase epsilon subunit [Clostridiales Family XIII bacterium PM5-7]